MSEVLYRLATANEDPLLLRKNLGPDQGLSNTLSGKQTLQKVNNYYKIYSKINFSLSCVFNSKIYH